MKMMDCVEVMVEREKYTRQGVHKGMQGWICYEENIDGMWLVDFPQCGEKDDIAIISMYEYDLALLPNGMDAAVNEEIKAYYDALQGTLPTE